MKIIAWNVNGIRSLMKKNYLYKLIDDEKPSIICFSETKVSCPLINIQIKGFKYRYWSPCKIKGGYSGTAIFSKKKPINVYYGLQDKDNKELDYEGRIICLEFDKFFLLHCYTPNSGVELARLDFRINIWDPAFKNYIIKLQKKKQLLFVVI